MNVIQNQYTTKGNISQETSLSSIFEEEVTSDQNPPEKAAELLANLTSLLVKKGVISLNEVADDILALDNFNDDKPALKASKK